MTFQQAALLNMPVGEMESRSAADGRYRTLLEVSGAIAAQPNLKAVLQSLRRLLSKVVAFDSIGLLLLSDNGNSVQLIALDRGPEAHEVEIGTEVPHAGTAVGRAIDEQKPIYVPDQQTEISRIPQLASKVRLGTPHSAYIFPISTSGKKLGALTFGLAQGDQLGPDDVELMTSVSSHVAVALESAIATDAAERYQRQLAQERDRLRLLLEINNQVVTQLDVNELFRSASASIRKYFANDFTGFWLIDKQSNKLECVVLDFPGGKGFLADIAAEVTDHDLERMRTRTPAIRSQQDIEKLPPAVLERLKAESIVALADAPLGTSNGPFGFISMGSKRPNKFGQEDLDILSQISAQISLALDNALAYGRLRASRNRLEDERLYLESEIRAEYNFEDLVGKSAALRKVLDQVEIVAPTGSTVLLRGETGTGKELIARAIHSHSPRRDRTFVRLNCAAIPSGLVESELFGHEKGAFTGALMQKRGRFELADHGTLFLDEIGDISPELQPKLLRALQEQEFERLGSNKTIHVDVRLIAATHRDLSLMIRNNQFREDLFYRLNVFPIEIPPLRERREDIPLLVHYFVSRLSRLMQKRIKSIPKPAMDALTNSPWPGNVRELENFIERAVILTQGDELNVPIAELKKSAVRNAARVSTFQEAERQAIIEALKAASGRISGRGAAAERLGLKRTTLQNKMRRLNIAKADY
jgi:formate hydrogenlyase transcriptional activator